MPGKPGFQTRAEGNELPFADGAADLRHQPQVEGDIVDREQRRAQHFVHLEQMVDVPAAEVPAGVASAIGLQGGRISPMPGVAQPERAVHGEGRGIPAVARGQHAIE